MSRRRQKWTVVVAWAAALGLLAWSLRAASPATLWEAVRNLPASGLLLLLVVNALVLLSFSLRWWLLLRAAGHRLPFLKLTAYRTAAFGLSYFTPGPQFGGEPLQVLLVRRHAVPAETAVAAVIVDKSIELLVNLLLLVAGLLFALRQPLLQELLGDGAAGGTLALLALLAALPLLYLAALARGWYPLAALSRRLPLFQRRFTRALQGLLATETRTGRLCRETPWALLAALAASLFSWLLLFLEFRIMLQVVGLPADWRSVILLLTGVRLAILLPLPAGLGAMEAALVLLLGRLGLAPEAGLTAALLIRTRDTLVGGVGLLYGLRLLRRARPAAAPEQADARPV
jgi:uncharacterized protein (TIRG00374 family)